MDDANGTLAQWLLAVFWVALILPVLLVVAVLILAAKFVAMTASAIYELARGNPYQRELRRTLRARNEAIRNIVALQHQAQRQMDRLMRQRAREQAIQRRRP